VIIKPFSEFFETIGIRWKQRGEEKTGDGRQETGDGKRGLRR
jgi:hypothetical protein